MTAQNERAAAAPPSPRTELAGIVQRLRAHCKQRGVYASAGITPGMVRREMKRMGPSALAECVRLALVELCEDADHKDRARPSPMVRGGLVLIEDHLGDGSASTVLGVIGLAQLPIYGVEGPVDGVLATAEDWLANAAYLGAQAAGALRRSTISADIAAFLREHGVERAADLPNRGAELNALAATYRGREAEAAD